MSQLPPPPPGSPTPPPAYGAPPPSNGWDLGATVNWAWAKFQQNLAMIVGALILIVGVVIIEFVGLAIVSSLTTPKSVVCDNTGTTFGCHTTGGTPFIVSMILSLAVGFVILVFAQIVAAGLIRGSLGVTQGRAFEIADVFNFAQLGQVVVTSLIVGAAVFVGSILCYIPGIIAGFLLSYSLYFVIDKDMAPMDAVKASYELTTKNLGSTIIWYLVGGLIAVAGAIACGIGIIATIPITLLGTAYTYKKLTGQEVVA